MTIQSIEKKLSWRKREIGIHQSGIQIKAMERMIKELVAKDEYKTEEGLRARGKMEKELQIMRVADSLFKDISYEGPKWWDYVILKIYYWSVKERFDLENRDYVNS